MRPLLVPPSTRYEDSVNPVTTDGRDVDSDLGTLSGEGSSQRSSGSTDEHLKLVDQTWQRHPDEQDDGTTYYERPLLKMPVWEWVIPFYYYIGGLTGASLVLSAAAQLRDAEGNRGLIRRCQWIAFAGSAVSAGCLVYDLGRPERFLNMLRVFRPTSAMNMGAWILTGVGATTPVSLLLQGRGGFLGAIGGAFGYLAGLFGAGLATYTGVLASSSAIPVWQQSRRAMPILFGAAAAGSVGSFFNAVVENRQERSFTEAFGIVGQIAELGAGYVMERQASEVERVGRPFREGASSVMWKTAAALTAMSVVANLIPGRSKTKRIAAGVLGTLGSMLMRFSIEQLGKASSLDARASFQQQRAGKGAAEVV